MGKWDYQNATRFSAISKKMCSLMGLQDVKPVFLGDIANHDEAIKSHLKYMLEKLPGMADDRLLDKANRWLGFIQGVGWAKGWTTIQKMRAANRELLMDLDVQHDCGCIWGTRTERKIVSHCGGHAYPEEEPDV